MRIQGGNVDSYRILESDLAPTEPVAPSKTPAATAPPKPPSSALQPASPLGFLARVASVFDGLADAFRGIARSLTDALVTSSRVFEEVTGSFLLAAGTTISSVQTLLHLEPAGRALTERERALARNVFGSGLSLDVIRLKSGHAGLYSLIDRERPFVLGNTVYTKNANPLSDDAFIHELTHVLQYQQRGAGYLAGSLLSPAVHGAEQPHDFAAQIAQGKEFAGLGHEQQAKLIAAGFKAGAIQHGKVVRPLIVEHDGKMVDCSAQLRAALAALAALSGTPRVSSASS
ncbi:MAG: hypothetical protein K0R38_5036 [Polyangiaceae bacterium]|nr:hypothetical protein [Polyangiaceae bacterium]